ncbi:hypothetical protein BC833DRAFT_580466 [Globomyces pollinis-pini]|nr:hypothetical protein BC833DRAFT_580466 [Globomyces pollinis-pini]
MTSTNTRLLVRNVSLTVTEYTLVKLFEPFGEIAKFEYQWHTEGELMFINVRYRNMRDNTLGARMGEPKGFVYVEYKDSDDAQRALTKMNRFHLDNKPLVVSFSTSKNGEDIDSTTKVFLGDPVNNKIQLAKYDTPLSLDDRIQYLEKWLDTNGSCCL